MVMLEMRLCSNQLLGMQYRHHKTVLATLSTFCNSSKVRFVLVQQAPEV